MNKKIAVIFILISALIVVTGLHRALEERESPIQIVNASNGNHDIIVGDQLIIENEPPDRSTHFGHGNVYTLNHLGFRVELYNDVDWKVHSYYGGYIVYVQK